ncbi:MAG TPA: hypothetical protein VE487_00240, partial [Ilumatobacter sp.]|nr:hypothetical protein [Ilumatobacter sp.]
MLIAAVAAMSGSAVGKTDVAGPTSPPPVTIQILTVSDWHGQLTPVSGVGGAAVLKAYFDQFRADNPNTLTFMAG